MKRFSITQALVLILILSACAPQAVPTSEPINLPGTIAAAASTSIAQTQAAIPTSTPTATFTNTPLPSPTFIPLPTLGATFTPGPPGNSGSGDPCIYQTLPPTLDGETIRIRMDNPIRAPLNVSVYLLQNGPQTICGYYSYTIEPQGTLVINNLVEGCYTIWAWNPDPDEYFMVTNGTSCLDDSRTWQFDVSTSSIRLRQ